MNNDDPPILVEVTNVESFPLVPHNERRVALQNSDTCLQILRNHSGNVLEFARYFGARDPREQQSIVFQAEQLLKTADKSKLKEWRELIKASKGVRIELLQAEALERMEGTHVAYEEKYTDKGFVVKFKESDDIAYFKALCPDLAAERIALVRAKPAVKSQNTTQDEEINDEDDDALLRAQGED